MAGAIKNEETEKIESQENAEKGRDVSSNANTNSTKESEETNKPTDDPAEDVTPEDKDSEDIAPECLIKHPLQNEWTLWYLEMDRTKTWEDMLNKITSFDTVEDFWSLYNHIRVASDLKNGNDYSLFKKNIRPMWEDEANKRGGRWIISLSRQQRRNELDTLWLDILLGLIGEAFEYPDNVCGAVVNVRPRGDKISVWTSDGSNKKAIMCIGQKIRESLRLSPETQLIYELHKDAANKSSNKTTYTC